ncbi:MAG TPA: hypothetical protein VD962_06195, partial [Rubricoccaceae bacterium]|nr:hypothetical protein [Rubricoccaceae bacterium]
MSAPTAEAARHRRAMDLFLDALDRPAAGRAAFLAAACDGDAALRDEIEALLAAHDDADSTGRLDRPLLDRPDPSAPDPLLGR